MISKLDKEIQETLLEEYGCATVKDYLIFLSEDYGVSYNTVCALYSIYGDSELFDGLVTAIEDASVGF